MPNGDKRLIKLLQELKNQTAMGKVTTSGQNCAFSFCSLAQLPHITWKISFLVKTFRLRLLTRMNLSADWCLRLSVGLDH